MKEVKIKGWCDCCLGFALCDTTRASMILVVIIRSESEGCTSLVAHSGTRCDLTLCLQLLAG